jgi:hypothetical protein
MNGPIQEALAPDTDAIPRATVEIGRYRNKWRVRWKDRQGYAGRRDFCDVEEAHTFFLEKQEILKQRP